MRVTFGLVAQPAAMTAIPRMITQEIISLFFHMVSSFEQARHAIAFSCRVC
jgi:hypothetical protein